MSKKTHKTSVGGQALIEGVMMQGPRGMATAVRKPDGEILTEYHTIKLLRNKNKFFNIPIIRGIVGFVESMVMGYKTLMYSAEVSGMEDFEEKDTVLQGRTDSPPHRLPDLHVPKARKVRLSCQRPAFP